jgi:multiple sugar transport system substrate-binding protein
VIRRVAAVAVLLASLLRSSVAAAPGNSIHLLVWQGFKFNEVSLLRTNISQFEESYRKRTGTNVSIEVRSVPFNEMIRMIRAAAQARQMPDMVFVDANQLVVPVYGGVARPLDNIPGFNAEIDQLRSQYVPGAFDTNVITFRGERHLYGLPAQTTTLALFWNHAMFQAKSTELRAAGLDPNRAPVDWDEFIKYGKILTNAQAGIYGFGMNNSLWFTMPFINQYGAKLVKRDSKGLLVPALRGPRAEAAIHRKVDMYLVQKIEGGAWREGAMDPDQGFANQKYAMVLTGPWMIENFRSSGLDFGVALIPRVPLDQARKLGLIPAAGSELSTATEALSAGNIGGQNMMISTTCAHPEIALEFARFFSGERVQRQWAEKLGQIPVCIAAQSNLDLSRFPEVPVLIRQIRLAKPVPPLPYGSALETEIFNPEINLVLQGRQTVTQAIDNVDRVLEARILRPVNEAELEARKSQ